MSEQNLQENEQNVQAAEAAETAAVEETQTEQTVVEPEIVTEEEIAAEEAASKETAEVTEETADNTTDSSKSEESSEEASKAEDWRDSYIRLAADFDNYRKRTSKEQDDIRRREREKVICNWLDVYDNAERALASLPEKEGPWYEGFASLIQQMDKCLMTYGIKPADDMGQQFDPKRHEAVAACPNPAMENNTIMHVERRGFVYENGNVVRVARVIVVKNPS